MVLLTLLSRVIDGLVLVGSVEDDTPELKPYKNQAKALFRKLSDTSPTRCSLETSGNFVFHYSIEAGVCYLVLCERSYPKRLAFAYLEELQKEFHAQHGDEVSKAARDYAFIKFDNSIQKIKRKYLDARGPASAQVSGLNNINTELQDVQRIMAKNIEEVLGRGERLDELSTKSANLSEHSRKYLKDAKTLKWQAMLQKWGPVGAVSLIGLFFLYLRFF